MPQRAFCTWSSAGACAQVLRHRIESCLAAGRSVVVAGDLNIAPYPFDHDNFADAPAWSAQHPAAKTVCYRVACQWKLMVLQIDFLGSHTLMACTHTAQPWSCAQ